jgi:hypothetical protein
VSSLTQAHGVVNLKAKVWFSNQIRNHKQNASGQAPTRESEQGESVVQPGGKICGKLPRHSEGGEALPEMRTAS